MCRLNVLGTRFADAAFVGVGGWEMVTVIRSMGLLQIYDPRTSIFTSLIMLRHSSRVSVHTGSFLSAYMHGENNEVSIAMLAICFT